MACPLRPGGRGMGPDRFEEVLAVRLAEAVAATPPGLDVERIRRDFPILERMVRDHRLVYLDNAATTQKPRQVLDTLARYYDNTNANIHRGVYTLSE